MRQRIDMRDPLSRAYWCGHLSCTEFDLIEAIHATRSRDIGVVGLYLATRFTLDDGESRPPGGTVCSVY